LDHTLSLQNFKYKFQLFVGVQDDLDDLDMDDDNSDHMNDDQGSADHDSDVPTGTSNSTRDDAVSCFRSHTGSVLLCTLMIIVSYF